MAQPLAGHRAKRGPTVYGLAQAAEVRRSHLPSLTLRLEQRQDIVLAHGALDVADNAARRVVHELDTDLDDTTARASAAEDLGHLSC